MQVREEGNLQIRRFQWRCALFCRSRGASHHARAKVYQVGPLAHHNRRRRPRAVGERAWRARPQQHDLGLCFCRAWALVFVLASRGALASARRNTAERYRPAKEHKCGNCCPGDPAVSLLLHRVLPIFPTLNSSTPHSAAFTLDGVSLHFRVRAGCALTHANLVQQAQTADRAPEQKDGGKDKCQRDQPKNQAVPYIPPRNVRSIDRQGETKNGNTGAAQQQEKRRNNPEHRPRHSSGASHLALLADSRLPSRPHHMRYTSRARHPNWSNSQRLNTLHPHSNDAKKVIDTQYTSVLFFRVFPNQNSHQLFSTTTIVGARPTFPRHFPASLSPFRINTYEIPRKCCNQRIYRITKFFRINTYEKHGGRGVLWLTNSLQALRGKKCICKSLVFYALRTLPRSVSCKSCICHSYENCRVYTNNSQSETHPPQLTTHCPLPTPHFPIKLGKLKMRGYSFV